MPRISSAGGPLVESIGCCAGELVIDPSLAGDRESGNGRAGRPEGRDPLAESAGSDGDYGVPHLSGQVFRVPAFIAAIAASSLAWRSAGTVAPWKSETPIPSLAALKMLLPALAELSAMPLSAASTALLRCFSALVTMHGSEAG